jgi:hypothetical protein
MKKLAVFLCLTILLLGDLAALSEAKDYIPSDIGNGEYVSVLQALQNRGDAILSLGEKSITSRYKFNQEITNVFLFIEGQLKEVKTVILDQHPNAALYELDKNFRRYGTPVEVMPLGKEWGKGFIVIWEDRGQTYKYTISDIPLGHSDHLERQEIIWTKEPTVK